MQASVITYAMIRLSSLSAFRPKALYATTIFLLLAPGDAGGGGTVNQADVLEALTGFVVDRVGPTRSVHVQDVATE